MPRQFMDLGPGATAVSDDVSHSSSEDRTISGSPRNLNTGKNEIVAFDKERDGKRVGRDESPESESQGWVPNKVPKLNTPKAIEQSTEATMRKARVSVRARSEAPMVRYYINTVQNLIEAS